jgi:hypothetical protein
LAPELLSAHQSLAQAFREWGQPSKEARALGQLLKRFPEHLETLLSLAGHYLRRDEPLAAREFAFRARRLKPLDAEIRALVWSVHLGSARHYALAGRWDEGRAEFAAAVAVDGREPHHVLVRRAALEAKAGDFGLARRLLDQARDALGEPAPIGLLMAIEGRRYALPQAVADEFENRWLVELKKSRRSAALGEMCRTVTGHLAGEVVYPGRDEHLSRLEALLGRSKRVKWQGRDLRHVLNFLIGVQACEAERRWKPRKAVGRRKAFALLAWFAAKARRTFPEDAFFQFLVGKLEIDKGRFACDCRLARESMTDAKLNANQIDKVVLVGGGSRTPLVHRLLEEQLGQPVHAEVDPDLCVAMGAAIQGGLIAGVDVGPVLVDITPHTLGIETLGFRDGQPWPYRFSPLIARNSPLPCRRSEMFATVHHGQKAARIVVFQGEDDDVRCNDQVGEVLLDGLGEVDAGNEVLVQFELNLDGILQVRATEQATGRQRELTIDNAVSRFRAARQAAAAGEAVAAGTPARSAGEGEAGRPPLVAADRAEDDAPPADFALAASRPAASASPTEQLTAEMSELMDRCERLMAKGEKLAGQTNPTDAAEMRRLVAEVRQAAERRRQDDLERGLAQLEDLVFYVEDA